MLIISKILLAIMGVLTIAGTVFYVLFQRRQPTETFDDDFDDHFMEPGDEDIIAIRKKTVDSPAYHPVTIDNDIITLNILAKPGQPFEGYHLLQALLAANMRFGEMNIFHRYSETDGSGEVIFSLASATEPGTFDINAMAETHCVGLTLFMRVNRDPASKHRFDLLIETANQLANDLQGELYDSQRVPFSDSTYQQYQQLLSA